VSIGKEQNILQWTKSHPGFIYHMMALLKARASHGRDNTIAERAQLRINSTMVASHFSDLSVAASRCNNDLASCCPQLVSQKRQCCANTCATAVDATTIAAVNEIAAKLMQVKAQVLFVKVH
jgi:hypothetical protein